MKTKEINVGNIVGLNSYEVAVKTDKVDGTLEEYIEKEQETYNKMVEYADAIKADMESILASVTNGTSGMSEVVLARSTYNTLGERLNATDKEIDIIIDRLNDALSNAEHISVTGMDKNVEMRNDGVMIQWKYTGYTKWNDLIAVDELIPKLKIGKVDTVNYDEKASVKLSGTKNNPKLDLSLPRGKDGIEGGAIIDIYRNDDGDVIARIKNNDGEEEGGNNIQYITPVFKIGKVETLPYNEKAYVTISGTPTNPELNFGIPAGKPTSVTRGYVGDDGLLKFELD